MKIKRFLLNLSISFALATAVLAYVDNRNPMMNFLSSVAGRTLLYTAAAVTILASAFALHNFRNPPRPKRGVDPGRRPAPRQQSASYRGENNSEKF